MIESGFERLGRILIGGIFLIVPSYIPVQTPFLYWLFTVTGLIMILTGLVGYSPFDHWVSKKLKK